MLVLLVMAAFFVLIPEMQTAKDISLLRKDYLRRCEMKTWPFPSLFSRFMKRLTDMVIALLVCVSFLPILYVVLGVIIKLTSAGPIIFRQKRVGLFGQEFVCYKFRSMYLNSEDVTVVRNDCHVTPIGRFMRKTHLDEFPQFVNVLMGDMSLVGPRPLSLRVTRDFECLPEYSQRLLVRPGITGLSQINSGRTLALEQILKFDLEYIRNLSWFNDWRIMAKTLCFADDAF